MSLNFDFLAGLGRCSPVRAIIPWDELAVIAISCDVERVLLFLDRNK